VITHIDDRPETRRSAPAARRLSKSLTAAAVALIAGLTLSGCTSTSAPAATPPASSTSTSSTTSSVSTSASPTPAGISSSVAAPATSRSTTAKPIAPTKSIAPTTTKPASSPPTTTALWPATLTPAQIKEAKSALTAYTAYYALLEQAFAKPGKDWSGPFAKVASDPDKFSILRYLKATAKLGQYGSGHIRLIPRVTKIQTAAVELTVCVDTSNEGFFDKTGKSIKAPDAPGSYYRHPSKAAVYEYVGNQWLVTTINDDFSKTC